jgi:hypothetical protein
VTPAATAAARTSARRSTGAATLPRPVAPRRPRRVSGPVRPARHGASPALAPPLGARLVHGAGQLVDHRLLDRLIRGRAWIGLVAFALIGIVAMQVALLKLNTGIGRSIERASTLQQQNTALEAQISTLASGDRVTTAAAAMGMVYPPAGDVGYLYATPGDAVRARRAMVAGLAQPFNGLALSAAVATTGSSGSGLSSTSSATGTTTVAGTTGATSQGSGVGPASAASGGGATAATPAQGTTANGSTAATTSAGTATGAAPPTPASSGASGGAAAAGSAGSGSTGAAPASAAGGPGAGAAGATAYPGSTGRR